MPCIPCLAAPLMYGSGLIAFFNKNKLVIIISIVILILSMYYYQKYKDCKTCKKKIKFI